MRRLLCAVALVAAVLVATPRPVAADSGWSISSFVDNLSVEADGSLSVVETIDAQFDVPKHGIYRDIPVRYAYNDQYDRVLEISDVNVGNGAGGSWPFSTSTPGDIYRIRIGDPSHELSGRFTYVVRYRVRGALNGFPDHDELYWNVTGNAWGVPIASADAVVHVPGGRLSGFRCFEGYSGSTSGCRVRDLGSIPAFDSTGPLAPGQGLTVVVALAKGTVPNPRPILVSRPRSLAAMFDPSPLALALFALALLAAVALAAWIWWSRGRDQRVAGSLETAVPEFEPPAGLRPAQVGLILHETATTRDVTATIVDLATRGYLTIEELESGGFLHSRHDYRLRKGAADPAQLLPFESAIWHELFDRRDEVRLSELRGTFRPTLDEAEAKLYLDAMRRRWFTHDPRWARFGWLLLGIALIVVGIAVAVVLGQVAGLGLAGAGIALGGLVLTVLHRWMPQRTGAGRDLLMHVLGFRMFMSEADRYQEQFAEKEKIFTAGLPYAIVFGLVDRWAHAFQGIDLAAATAGWYVGSGYLGALAFSSGLQSFSNTVGASIAYVPAARGSSGFGGGGFSGGGFGGGGGGSW